MCLPIHIPPPSPPSFNSAPLSLSPFSSYAVNAVDGMVAGQLVKLGDKYPVLNKQPGEVRDL